MSAVNSRAAVSGAVAHHSGLRPYQRECVERVLAAYRAGRRRVLVSLPTGTGKTVVFASFPRELRMKKKLLILAHRDELLEQAREKLASAAPGVDVTIEQGQRRANPAAQVVVASVPTLGRANSKRLSALNPEEFSVVVVDEAHHAVAKSYRRIFDRLGLFSDGNALLVGFTATPRRGDGRGLGDIFQDIVYSRGMEEMIREGWLCPITGWRVTTDVNLDRVEVRNGDFIESQLARAINVRTRNDAVLGACSKYASGRRAIVFCADVAHAKAMADTFLSAGIRARAVWGEMPRDARREALESLRSGETAALTNCNVLAEGFDEPSVDCVVMARPTKSRLLYTQMIGRGTRRHPGKQNLVVIDVADNSREHSLAGIHNVLDLPEGMDLKGANALTVADSIREIADGCPWIETEHLRNSSDVRLVRDAMSGVVRANHLLAERIRFFSFEPPAAIRGLTNLAWHSAPGGDFALEIGGDQLVITQCLLGVWELFLLPTRERKQRLEALPRLESIIAFADDWVHKERPESIKLVNMGASWRHLPSTEKQLAQLRNMHAPVPRTLTRGQASWIISHRHGASSVSLPR